MRSPGPPRHAVGAFATIYLVWGSTFLAIRYAVETVPPIALMAYRSVTAGVLLLLGAWAWNRLHSAEVHWPSIRQWRHAAAAGVALFVAGHGSLAVAERHVPSGVAALAMATIPLWLVVFDALRPGGKFPAPRGLLGLVVGLGAICLLTSGDWGQAAGLADVESVLLLLGSAASWAAGSMYARHAPRPASAAMHTGAQLLAGGIALLVLSAVLGEHPLTALGAASPRSLAALAYLVLLGSVAGFTAYTWLLRVSTPGRVGTYAFVNPLVAVVLGWAVAGEALTPTLLLVLALVLAGLWLVLTAPAAAASRPGSGPAGGADRPLVPHPNPPVHD